MADTSIIESSYIKELSDDFESSSDLNLNGFSLLDTKAKLGFQLYDVKTNALYASRNRALLWFASKKGDYVREPNKGGVLYSLLGQLCSSTNLTQWENVITQSFNSDFNGDLTLLSVKLSVNKGYRSLNVDAYFRDNVTTKVDNVTFSAE